MYTVRLLRTLPTHGCRGLKPCKNRTPRTRPSTSPLVCCRIRVPSPMTRICVDRRDLISITTNFISSVVHGRGGIVNGQKVILVPVPQHFDTRPRSETDSHQNLLDSPRPELDPISHEIASRTPPELACLQDNIYFDDSPWPEIETHPIPDGINPHSPSVQQEQPYSPNELQNSGRKRKEPSRDDAEIPFEIVNCGRPAKSERQIICEAIRSIKQINGCRLISDEREDEYKILTIKEDQIYRFLSQVVQKKRNKYNLHRFGLANLLDVTQEQYSQVQQKRRQCALLRFKREANTRKLKLYVLYTDPVISVFKDSILDLKERIKSKYSRTQASYLLKELQCILKTLPIYLFHVDLINTLIPAQGVTTLESQRQEAGQQFFKYIQGLIANLHTAKDTF
ncbi:hypothetical protein PtA15_2A171 [Puccinia triticina]|uniref:Uncharacterized protein n=1 Tax=Puccinia triticina TaxID=208348 RepID=A0ABY7CAA3_9BASI|nr:uncharacterized protein PtA15_2A171 [Puccinia triticina]WAQ81858.1 hypothetical protein PtA15_2A171 [Puccinia triticina]